MQKLHLLWVNRIFSAVIAAAVLIAGSATPVRAEVVIWDGVTSGDASWTNPDSNSWTGGTYDDSDDAKFLGAGVGVVTIPTTVTPGSITVSNSLGNDYTISGTIAGTGVLTKDGAGKLTLSGAASAYLFSSITVDGGVMEVSGNEYSKTVNIDNGATYRHGSVGTDYIPTLNFGTNGGATFEVLSGNPLQLNTTVTTTGGAENFITNGWWNAINPTLGAIYTFNVAAGTDPSDLTLSTRFFNWPKIFKTGAGTMTLTASNTQIAPTIVSQGTLLFNGTTSTNSPDSPSYGHSVIVTNTGTLGGTSTIIEPVSVLANGTLAAGDTNSVGILTLTDGLSFAGASTKLVARVTGVAAAQQNKIVVTGGGINLGSATLIIDSTGVSDIPAQHELTIIDNQTASPISGTFNGLAEDTKISGWVVSYTGGTGNDVVLTLAPRATTIILK